MKWSLPHLQNQVDALDPTGSWSAVTAASSDPVGKTAREAAIEGLDACGFGREVSLPWAALNSLEMHISATKRLIMEDETIAPAARVLLVVFPAVMPSWAMGVFGREMRGVFEMVMMEPSLS